jgi:hypothetical protein
MKNVTSAFELLTGKAPNDLQLQTLHKLKQTLGIRDHDALWEVMIALQYHLDLFKEIPDAIREMAQELIENLKDASSSVNQDFESSCIAEMDKAINMIQAATKRFEAESQKNISESQKDFTKSIRNDSLSIMKDVSEKDKLRWMSISFATCGVASLIFAGVGFWLGGMKGYNDAVDVNTKYHWSNTSNGKVAFRLYEGGDIHKLATCSGKGWKEKGNVCYPKAIQEGKNFNTYGYQLRQ